MFHTLLKGMVLYFLKVRSHQCGLLASQGWGEEDREEGQGTERHFVDWEWSLRMLVTEAGGKADGSVIILDACWLLQCSLESS